jgi:hypothetical protein
MSKHDVVDHIKVGLRDGLTAPNKEAATALIDRLIYEQDANEGADDGVPWGIGNTSYRALLRKDLDWVLYRLSVGDVEYEGVGFDETPSETAPARRLAFSGVLEAAGLVAYRPASGWVPLTER